MNFIPDKYDLRYQKGVFNEYIDEKYRNSIARLLTKYESDQESNSEYKYIYNNITAQEFLDYIFDEHF